MKVSTSQEKALVDTNNGTNQKSKTKTKLGAIRKKLKYMYRKKEKKNEYINGNEHFSNLVIFSFRLDFLALLFLFLGDLLFLLFICRFLFYFELFGHSNSFFRQL